MHEITLRVSITPWRLRLLLALLLCVLFPRVSTTQDVSILTTYFPAQAGAMLNTSVVSNVDLAKNGGAVQVGGPSSYGAAMVVGRPASLLYLEDGLARVVVNGNMTVNGCIWLKNGLGIKAGAPTNTYWRCLYNPTGP